MSQERFNTSLQAAYILHYNHWRESSLILDAFTLNHGRVSLVARSARQSQPRIRALYQPFRPLLLSWVGGRDLRPLTGIEEAGPSLTLTGAALACAYYINELVLRLLGKDQQQQAVFAHYALALSDLSSAGETGSLSMEAVLRVFELQLLEALAVLPDLTHCTADGSPIEAQCDYDYYPANALAIVRSRHIDDANGSIAIPKRGSPSGSGDPALHADGVTRDAAVPVSGRTLLALSSLEVDDPLVLKEARPLMRQILRVHLGDRPLRSRELFASLARGG